MKLIPSNLSKDDCEEKIRRELTKVINQCLSTVQNQLYSDNELMKALYLFLSNEKTLTSIHSELGVPARTIKTNYGSFWRKDRDTDQTDPDTIKKDRETIKKYFRTWCRLKISLNLRTNTLKKSFLSDSFINNDSDREVNKKLKMEALQVGEIKVFDTSIPGQSAIVKLIESGSEAGAILISSASWAADEKSYITPVQEYEKSLREEQEAKKVKFKKQASKSLIIPQQQQDYVWPLR